MYMKIYFILISLRASVPSLEEATIKKNGHQKITSVKMLFHLMKISRRLSIQIKSASALKHYTWRFYWKCTLYIVFFIKTVYNFKKK